MAARVKHEATVSETRFVFYRNTWSGPCDTVYNNRTFDFCRQQLHECLHTAAIAGYPELSCKGEPGTPRIIWGVEDIVMCAGKEETFKFLEDVIDGIGL